MLAQLRGETIGILAVRQMDGLTPIDEPRAVLAPTLVETLLADFQVMALQQLHRAGLFIRKKNSLSQSHSTLGLAQLWGCEVVACLAIEGIAVGYWQVR